MQFRNSLADIQLYVKEGVGTNLLGMDWIRKVGLAITCIEFLKSLGGPVVLPVEVIAPIALNGLLYEFSDILQEELGRCSEKASIQVRPDADLKIIPFRRPLKHLRKQIELELDRLVEREVLEPVNNSLCAFPTVNIVKQSGSVRVCGDFKDINKFMVVDQHPIPHLSDLFTVLVGRQKFSKIDLSDAYNQLELDSESQKYLVIYPHKGLFKFRRLPFGVSSAPDIFQRVRNKMLNKIKKTTNFFDYFLVTGSDDEEHLKSLSEVLKRISDHGLRLKEDKSSFFQSSVQYLGHIIDKHGIQPSKEKIKAIQDMPIPTNQADYVHF